MNRLQSHFILVTRKLIHMQFTQNAQILVLSLLKYLLVVCAQVLDMVIVVNMNDHACWIIVQINNPSAVVVI